MNGKRMKNGRFTRRSPVTKPATPPESKCAMPPEVTKPATPPESKYADAQPLRFIFTDERVYNELALGERPA